MQVRMTLQGPGARADVIPGFPEAAVDGKG